MKFSDDVLVITGGWGPERVENVVGGMAVNAHMTSEGRRCHLVDVKGPLDFAGIVEYTAGFAFLAHTEELPTIPILDALGIRHSGPVWSSVVLSYDKAVTYAVCDRLGITTPRFQLIRNADLSVFRSPWPAVVVKPRRGGSSVGIAFAADPATISAAVMSACRYDGSVLVEEYLPGAELTVAAFGSDVYAILEVDIGSRPIFDYEAKAALQVAYRPLAADDAAQDELRDWTVRLADALELENSFWRADYRTGSDGLCLIDLNALPFLGWCAGGMIESMTAANGETYSSFLDRIESSRRC